MDNNDKFRRIRYIFNISDVKMLEMFKSVDQKVSKITLYNWLIKDDEPGFEKMRDVDFASFLNGFIIDKRGRREGPLPVAERRLTNNIVLKKLKIALNLKTDDILDLFALTNKKISPHELSAFLRNPKQSQYRQCNDQYLRNFLNGLLAKYRAR